MSTINACLVMLHLVVIAIAIIWKCRINDRSDERMKPISESREADAGWK